MRRTLASLLLVLSLAGFALPFLQAQSRVPACCRRAGQHHCGAAAPGDGFHATQACCPYRNFTALTSHSVTALRMPSQAMYLSLRWQPVVNTNSTELPRYVFDPAQKRGPPLA